MKKFFLCLMLLTAAVSMLPAANPGFNTRNTAELKAALKKTQPPIRRIAYELRLRELEGRIKISNYEEYCRAIFKIGTDIKARNTDVEDCKIALPFLSGRFTAEALKAAHEMMHPYELRYLTAKRCKWQVRKLMPTPMERYMRTLKLLKWNTAKYHAWGSNCSEVIKGLEYMKAQAAEGYITRFGDDVNQLKMVFRSWQVNNPKQWKPVYDWLNRNSR